MKRAHQPGLSIGVTLALAAAFALVFIVTLKSLNGRLTLVVASDLAGGDREVSHPHRAAGSFSSERAGR